MKYKALGALICILITISCPLACFASDIEAANNKETCAMIKLNDLSNDKINEVFGDEGKEDVESSILSYILPAVGLNENISWSSEVNANITGLNYKSGSGFMFAGDEKSAKAMRFISYDCNIDLKYTGKEGSDLQVLEDVLQYEGDAYNQLLKNFGNEKFIENSTVQIQGKISVEEYIEADYNDLFKAGDQFYPLKIEIIECHKLKFDLDIKINDKASFHDELSERTKYYSDEKYEIINGEQKDYKEDSLQSLSGSVGYTLTECEGTKKINNNPYKYGLRSGEPSFNYGPVIENGPEHIDIDTEEKYADLPLFDHEKEEKEIEDAVAKAKGTCTKNYSDFEKEANSVKSDFEIRDDTQANLMIFYAIAAFIIVALVLIYFYNKKKNSA